MPKRNPSSPLSGNELLDIWGRRNRKQPTLWLTVLQQVEGTMKFLRRIRGVNREHDFNIYELDCACGVTGELGVPVRKMNKVFTHDTCNAMLIQKPGHGIFGKPYVEVICAGAKKRKAKAASKV